MAERIGGSLHPAEQRAVAAVAEQDKRDGAARDGEDAVARAVEEREGGERGEAAGGERAGEAEDEDGGGEQVEIDRADASAEDDLGETGDELADAAQAGDRDGTTARRQPRSAVICRPKSPIG
jgi:hypothetical protein